MTKWDNHSECHTRIYLWHGHDDIYRMGRETDGKLVPWVNQYVSTHLIHLLLPCSIRHIFLLYVCERSSHKLQSHEKRAVLYIFQPPPARKRGLWHEKMTMAALSEFKKSHSCNILPQAVPSSDWSIFARRGGGYTTTHLNVDYC